MRRFFRFFAQRWVISFLGLLALALIIWFAGPLIAVAGHEPLGGQIARLVTIIVLVVLWGLNNLRVQMKSRKASEQMMDNLAQPSADEVMGVRGGESAEEVAVLKQRFEEAMEVLKKSAKSKGARNLYELPWYIIIGPPGSGKTTALVNSGLNFPLADRFGKEALRGVGGTRNCDWWFTDEAVLLDTAGRYVTQDSDAAADSAAWEGFLNLLKKHRRRRPINGVMVAISVSDLLLLRDYEREAHVKAVKQRIQELNKHLGIRFPVYVLFTKCDLVAGFMEFFDDLGREERAQVWGTTFPYQKGAQPGTELFGAELDALMRRIDDRLLWRLNQERDQQRRGLIYGFPAQLAGLKEVLESFLQDVFRPSRYEEPTLLRGVYFTSGTQEGTPIDRVIGSIVRSFGLDRQALRAFGGSGRSYFITGLLRDVIFQEAALAGADRRFERQRAWAQRAAYAGAIGATVVAALAWSTSFTQNQTYITRMQEKADAFHKVVEATPNADADVNEMLQRLDALKAMVDVYKEPEEHGVPLTMGLGLYQGDKLGAAARDAYVRGLNRELLPHIAGRLESQLRRSEGDVDFQYEALKTYLMLGEPKHLSKDQITLWMTLDWQNRFPADAEKRGRLEAHLTALLNSGIEPMGLDQQLVQDVRLRLTQRPLAELVYGRLKRDYEAGDKSPFLVTAAAGAAASKVFTRASGAPLDEPIPGLFTYRGFYEGFQKQSHALVAQVRKESWVLGTDRDDLSRAELEQLDSGLLKLYLDDYIRRWDGLLSDLRIVPFRSITQGAEVADLLSGPKSPMRQLLQAVERNTSLNKLPPSLAKLAQKAGQVAGQRSRLARLFSSGAEEATAPKVELPGDPVEKKFEDLDSLVRSEGGSPAPIDRLMNLLSDLYGYLSGLSGGPQGGGALSAAQGKGDDILRRMQIEATRLPEPVKSWFQQLAQSTRSVTVGGARTQLGEIYSSTVASICNGALKDRYPFYKDARQEVNLKDFGRIFGPGGVLDKFFNDNLRPFVDTSQTPWRSQASGNVSLGISPSVLTEFQRAAVIRDTFFQDGGQSPSVHFGLKPLDLSPDATQFLLDLEGQKIVYRHGPTRIINATWPGPDAPSQVRIVFEDTSGNRPSITEDGPWAWFRILDRSKLEPLSSDRIRVTFSVAGLKATYEIRANSVINPFMMKELQEFRCPGGL